MKTIVGVDSTGLYRPALNLLSRLNFENQRVHLLHVGEQIPLMMPLTPGGGEFPVAQLEEEEREAGQALLERTVGEASECGLPAEASYDIGNPAHCLIATADREEAGLVAVGAARKGKYGSFFLGSVGRGLVIGAHQSVLVVKGDVEADGGVKAVLATDHSEYANRCVDHLLSLRPRGIESITVVTATDADSLEDLARRYARIHGDSDEERQYTEGLAKLGSAVADKFKAQGCDADFRVMKGQPQEAIRQAMEEKRADLLILGAQGHGFMERLMIGSFSLQQVVAEPHSTLIVRLQSGG